MWIVIKYKKNELKTLKDSFCKILGDMPEFYSPKMKIEKYVNNKLKIFEKNILDNYLICKHTKFRDRTLRADVREANCIAADNELLPGM